MAAQRRALVLGGLLLLLTFQNFHLAENNEVLSALPPPPHAPPPPPVASTPIRAASPPPPPPPPPPVASDGHPIPCVRGPFLFLAVHADATDASTTTLDAYRRTWLSRLSPQRRRPLAPTLAQYRFFMSGAVPSSIVDVVSIGEEGDAFRGAFSWATRHVGLPHFYLTVDLRSKHGQADNGLAFVCLDMIVEELR